MSLDGSPLVWVIGAGGLLGRAVLQGQSVVAPSVRLWVPGTQIPWTNPQAAADHLGKAHFIIRRHALGLAVEVIGNLDLGLDHAGKLP